MPLAKVIGPLAIDGEPVEAGAVVELSENAFQNLLRKNRIIPAEDSGPEPGNRESEIKVSKRKRKE